MKCLIFSLMGKNSTVYRLTKFLNVYFVSDILGADRASGLQMGRARRGGE